MIVPSGPQVYMTKQRESAATLTPAGGSNFASSSPGGGNALSGKLDILSEMSTSLGDGRTLSAFRFALGGAGLQAQLSGSGTAPSDQDRVADQQMFSAFSQLAAYFGSSVDAKNTQLAGTAALDIRL